MHCQQTDAKRYPRTFGAEENKQMKLKDKDEKEEEEKEEESDEEREVEREKGVKGEEGGGEKRRDEKGRR